jgi:hypothetical protein
LATYLSPFSAMCSALFVLLLGTHTLHPDTPFSLFMPFSHVALPPLVLATKSYPGTMCTCCQEWFRKTTSKWMVNSGNVRYFVEQYAKVWVLCHLSNPTPPTLSPQDRMLLDKLAPCCVVTLTCLLIQKRQGLGCKGCVSISDGSSRHVLFKIHGGQSLCHSDNWA